MTGFFAVDKGDTGLVGDGDATRLGDEEVEEEGVVLYMRRRLWGVRKGFGRSLVEDGTMDWRGTRAASGAG